MSDAVIAEAHCVCGAVRARAPIGDKHVGACHCETCRRWGGGPSMMLDCGTDVHFEGEKHITVYVSSDWAERGFCKACGSHLFYRLRESGQTFMPAGMLHAFGGDACGRRYSGAGLSNLDSTSYREPSVATRLTSQISSSAICVRSRPGNSRSSSTCTPQTRT